MTTEELDRVEDLTNRRIRENISLQAQIMAIEDAKKTGAMALFGEKYGDKARVVTIGDFSKELCGGTHSNRTGDVGLLKILSETGIAAGVRRIEALTGADAIDYIRKGEATLQKVAAMVKSSPDEVEEKLEKILVQTKKLEREVESLKTKIATGGSDLMGQVREIGGVRVLATKPGVGEPRSLREVGDRFKERIGSGIVFLAGEHRSRAALILMITKDLTNKFDANKIMKELAEKVGGTGGGRPDMAQGGGPQPKKIDEAMKSLYAIIEKSAVRKQRRGVKKQKTGVRSQKSE